MENIPARFSNQKAIEVFSKDLSDENFLALCDVLKGRKWTTQEFKDRIQPMRPNLDLSAYTE